MRRAAHRLGKKKPRRPPRFLFALLTEPAENLRAGSEGMSAGRSKPDHPAVVAAVLTSRPIASTGFT